MNEEMPPILSDAAFEFIKSNSRNKEQADDSSVSHFSFDGDWGNWNWLFAEIWKRSVK